MRADRLFWTLVCVAGALVVLVVPSLEPARLKARVWSLRHLADLAWPLRLAFSVGLVALAVPAIREGVANGLGRLLGSAGSRWGVASAAALSGVAFWLLRTRNFALGDSAHLIEATTYHGHAGTWSITYDEPLELIVHGAVYRLLHPLFDCSAETAFALVSVLCGVAFVVLLVALAREVAVDPRRRIAFALIVVSGGALQLYFGSVENYTIVNLAVLAYVLAALRALDGRARLHVPALLLGLAMSLHMLAGWLLPTLAYLVWMRARTSTGSLAPKTAITAAAALLLPLMLTVALVVALGVGVENVKTTHLWQLKFIFLLDESYPAYQYPLLSGLHFRGVVNQLVLTALPGLFALAFVAAFHRAAVDLRDTRVRLLCIAAVFLQVFAATWHPDLGAYQDWDLFAICGVGYTLLGAFVLVRSVPAARVLPPALVIAALCGGLTGSFVLSNSRTEAGGSPPHDEFHLVLAAERANESDDEGALANLREAVRLNPDNSLAHLNLGHLLAAGGDREASTEHYHTYLVLDPGGPHAPEVRRRLGLPPR